MAAKTKAVPRGKKKATQPEHETISHAGIGARRTLFEGAWFDLAKAYGGVEQLATMIGVSYSTLHRWAVRGDPVPKTSRMVIGMLCAQRNLKLPIFPEG